MPWLVGGANFLAMSDARDDFMSRIVSGKTFAEVGGLWGTISERISVAHTMGATELTMIDVTTEGDPLWTRFEARMKELAVPDYRCVVSDICAVQGQSYANVHCSGVLYHHPNPQHLLGALRGITEEHLVLSSAVTQESVSNEHGEYSIPPSGVIFVPALSEQERAVLGAYWREVGAEAHGITEPASYSPDEFGPWWWLPTAKAMAGMASAAGFEVLDDAPIWAGNAHTLLLRRI